MIDMPDFLKHELKKTFGLQLKSAKSKCTKCNQRGIIDDNSDHTYYDCPECTGRMNAVRQYIYSNIRDSQFYKLRRDEMAEYLTDKSWKTYYVLYNNIIKVLENKNLIIGKMTSDTYGISQAAVILLKKLIYSNQDSFMLKFDNLIEGFFAFRDNVKDVVNRKEELLQFYMKVPFLLIDNFADEFINPKGDKDNFITQKLMQFLQARQNNGVKTIIALAISQQSFTCKYDTTFLSFFDENYLTYILDTKPKKIKQDAELGLIQNIFLSKTTSTSKKFVLKKN